MLVGLDFDNTIVLYDELFRRLAVERYGMPDAVPPSKVAVRAWFWSQPEGNTPWTELQGVVYGTRIQDAELAPGVEEFLTACVARGVHLAIVSHKTQYPALGPRVDLRAAARDFLAAKGLLDSQRTGLTLEQVSFCPTRDAKVAEIARRGCDAFVDDLPEVFSHPAFPAATRKVLYDRTGAAATPPPQGIKACGSWKAIRRLLLEGS